MPGQALLEITGTAVATLEAALEAFENEDAGSQHRDAPSKRDVVAAAEGVKNDAAKGALSMARRPTAAASAHSAHASAIPATPAAAHLPAPAPPAVGVMCSGDSGGGALPQDIAGSLIGALQQSALGFCACCYALAGAGAGPSLRKEVRALAAGVVEPVVGLLRALVRRRAGAWARGMLRTGSRDGAHG
jgi:hypothetical protein